MFVSPSQLTSLIGCIREAGSTPAEFILQILQSDSHDAAMIMANVDLVLEAIYVRGGSAVLQWARDITFNQCEMEVIPLTLSKSGFHFHAEKTTEDKINNFSLEALVQKFRSEAPTVWEFLGVIMDVNTNAKYQRDRQLLRERHITHERQDLLDVRRATCMSMVLNTANNKCNSFQSMCSLFLHAANTPETVHELLAHMGLATSLTTMNNAISNLSRDAGAAIRANGKTLSMIYAFDNIDFNLRRLIPTIDNASDSLVHLTTATSMPLRCVTADDLDCYSLLQARNRASYQIPGMSNVPRISPDRFFEIHLEPNEKHPSGLTRRQRYNAYMFLRDLTTSILTPQYFHQFRCNLREPDVIEQIPIEKTTQTPLKTMDINPSTVVGNAEILAAIFRQAGVGDQSEDPHVEDIGDHVVLVSGDLLTGDRIRSLLESRSVEETKMRQLNFVIYVMGLFHFKMACADAIWRLFIGAVKGHTDTSSLIELIGQIRPRQTGKFTGSNPGFRHMHEVIQHVGEVMRLDCWRRFSPLDQLAKSKPTWDQLESIAYTLAKNCVGDAMEITALRKRFPNERDQQYENTLILMQYLMLYEETSYAMNTGDIGRLESTFCPWIWIFSCCGKHKYASELRRYLEDVHFIYPKSLSKAIRMNILCNPLGKKGTFRAIDWLVEWNNLFIKRIYGGKFSNHTKARIIKESCLIEIYKRIRVQVEQMFHLTHTTTKHSLPDLESTLGKLAAYIEKEQLNIFIKGRTAGYNVPNAMADGMEAMFSIGSGSISTDLWDNLPIECEVGEDDLEAINDDELLH